MAENQTSKLKHQTSDASDLPQQRDSRGCFALMPDPTPYKTIAVASTFSPRFVQVLAEAKRVRDRFSCDLNLIYVGEKNDETTAKFRDVLGQLSLPLESTIHYQQGLPVEGILSALSGNKIDMIIAGALEKEVVLHPFLGGVARRLVREATCAVMLFTHPEIQPRPLRKIVFVADYSEHALAALKRTLHFASAEKTERLYVVRVITAFDTARAKAEGTEQKDKTADEEEAELEKFVLSAGETAVPMEARCIRGNTGFAASDFVQSVEADLLVVPVQTPSDQSLPSNIAWITDVIPCNLWVIR
jgi:nucleotide-binding universal stress UspA family protein